MSGQRRFRWGAVVALVVLGLVAGMVAGCGGDDEEAGTTPIVTETTTDTTETDTTETDTTEPDDGEAAAGADVYSVSCQTCHGAEGEGGIGPNLQTSSAAEDLDAVEQQVRNGGGAMPAFEDTLSDEEIQAVAQYVVDELAPRG